ncbi:hypothetical protein [Mycobacterium camsae]|uniref:hypothetical protein n=1 Tax=Mycobacterium gordonae TaxID=1778 RepID=UPI0019819693|nr:hypothetical protein [Mycobacterium gordonae]
MPTLKGASASLTTAAAAIHDRLAAVPAAAHGGWGPATGAVDAAATGSGAG